MNEDTPFEFRKELLDDFFAEADEHLLGIRQSLAQLESAGRDLSTLPKIIEALFQHFHSFKGISAIVGLTAAEDVAHATESFLRLLREGKVEFSPGGLETLMAVAQNLEQIVAGFRDGKTGSSDPALLLDLQRQCETPEEPLTQGKVLEKSDAATPSPDDAGNLPSANATIWKCIFTPSQELNAGGINVNTTRAQLSEQGEILKCTPLIKGQGKVAFEFLVRATKPLAEVSDWVTQGLTVQMAEPAVAESNSNAHVESPVVEDANHNPFLAPSHFVRVDLKRLDELMRITGELVIQRSRLESQLHGLNGKATNVDLRGVQEVNGNLGRSLRDLREAIMDVRMVPAAEIFSRMPFVVRDLARQSDKKVRLDVVGQDTAMDKYLIERLKDPLLHLVRNAFSHGVQTPAERLAAGKDEEARIALRASASGDSIIIEVEDDGKGIDPAAIVERAKKRGLEIPATVDNDAILKILCATGFSTRDDADRASGRGVGMAVVLDTVRELGGALALQSEKGRGTKFTLRLPLTLAIAETFIVKAAGQTCAVPQSFVREIVATNPAQIHTVDGIEVIPYRTGVLPIVHLTGIFRLKSEANAKMCVLVIESDLGSTGLLVETVLGQREVVVRALADPLIQVPGISGATELGDGKPILILDGAALIKGTVRPPERSVAPKKQKPTRRDKATV